MDHLIRLVPDVRQNICGFLRDQFTAQPSQVAQYVGGTPDSTYAVFPHTKTYRYHLDLDKSHQNVGTNIEGFFSNKQNVLQVLMLH